ncbi:MAG: J domain-containing protein [Dehalococcoidales bacterium]|nr:J domain-containing protein [Dehalococcoidales bacterium]
MEERMKKSRQEFAELFQGWWNQWLQEIFNDSFMQQYFSAAQGRAQTISSTGIDVYRILGLQKTDPDDAVKNRFRELSRKLHPDTAGVPGTEFLFQLVLAAYQQISRERGWQK